MDTLMMNLNIQANNKKLINKQSNSFIKTNKENSFDKVLNEKINKPKEDHLKTSTNEIKNEKTDMQRENKEIKKEMIVKEVVDQEDVENVENVEKDNIPEDIMAVIASLNACIEELAKAQETAENNENTTIKVEDIKSQLNEILSFMEQKNAIDIKDNVVSKEVLEQLKNQLEMLLDQKEVELDLQDFNKVLSKLENLIAEETTNQSEKSSIVAGEAVNKDSMDTLHTTKEDTELETDTAKNEIFVNQKNKTETNAENERQMSQNDKNNEKFGFFANKTQKVTISDKSIQEIPTNFMIQNNTNGIENVKLEVANIQRPNFQNILEQVVEKAQVIVDEKGSEMTLQLKPDHLGNLSMKIAVERGIVIANIVAENQAVKEVLESNFNALRDALNEKGFGIQELNVSVGQDSDFQKQQNFMNSKKKNNGKTMVNGLDYENVLENEEINRVRSMSESTIDQLG